MPQARVAFQYPSFRYYMMARFLITASSEMQSVAIGWQVYNLTHRPRDLGLVGLSQFLPGILLFLVAGHTADRMPRHLILQACYGAFSMVSLLLLTLTFHGLHSVWPIYGALLLNGTVCAFNMPTGQAFLPQLVKETDFPNAVAWGSSILQVALTIGPMASGLIYGMAGTPLPVYGSAAAAYLIGLVLISRIRVQVPQRPRGTASTGVLLEGLRFIWRESQQTEADGGVFTFSYVMAQSPDCPEPDHLHHSQRPANVTFAVGIHRSGVRVDGYPGQDGQCQSPADGIPAGLFTLRF